MSAFFLFLTIAASSMDGVAISILKGGYYEYL